MATITRHAVPAPACRPGVDQCGAGAQLTALGVPNHACGPGASA